MRDQPPKSNSRLALSVCNFVQTHAGAEFSLLSFRAPSMSPLCPDAWYRAPTDNTGRGPFFLVAIERRERACGINICQIIHGRPRPFSD